MENLVFGLVVLALGVTVQRLFLMDREQLLRANEQAFEFHKLRDELQLAAAEGIIKQNSLPFEFLMQMFNIAIKNAGILTLTQSLALAKRVAGKSDRGKYEAVLSEIQKHDPRIQGLAARFFSAFATMLIANDWFISAVISLTRHHLSNQLIVESVRPIRRLRRFPRVQLIGYIRRYSSWSQQLGHC